MYDLLHTIDSPAASRRLDTSSPYRPTGSLPALFDPLRRLAQHCGFPVVIEEHPLAGGARSAWPMGRTRSRPGGPTLRSGSPEAFVDHDALLDGYGLDANNIQAPGQRFAERMIPGYFGWPKAVANKTKSPARELRSA